MRMPKSLHLSAISALVIVILFSNTNTPFAYAASSNTKIYYYLHDHLGGIAAVTDEEGNVVCRNDYLPFGEARYSDCTEKEDYGFTGKEKDPETGLFYYGARYYDALIGRFVTPDPWEGNLTDPQTQNTYSYGLNNPVRYTDPTGMIPKDASARTKLRAIRSYENTGKGSGWLASAFRRYMDHPNPKAYQALKALQNFALKRFERNPAAFTDQTWDSVTNKRIQTLDPRLHIPATNLINRTESEQGKTLRVSDAYRTLQQQAEKYAQGRTTEGSIVTNALPGYSYHNYGLALDVAEIKNKQLTRVRIGEAIVKIAQSLGFEWGGSFKDYPHFQMTFGQSVHELFRRHYLKK